MMQERTRPETTPLPLALQRYMDAVCRLAEGLRSSGISWEKFPQFIAMLELYLVRCEQRAELAGGREPTEAPVHDRLKAQDEWRKVRKKMHRLKRSFGGYAEGPLSRFFPEDEYQYLYPRAPSIPANPWLVREVRIVETGREIEETETKRSFH